MIIECPHCLTRFRLDEVLLTGKAPRLRCSRCRHIFPAPVEAVAKPGPIPKSSGPQPFPEGDGPLADAQSDFVLDDKDSWVAEEAAGDEPAQEEFSFIPAPPPAPITNEVPAPEQENIAEEDEKWLPETISLRPVFIFLFLVVSQYAVLAGTLYANPAWTERFVRRIPLVGDDQGQFLSRKVRLVDVSGRYARTRAGKTIFLVQGYAENQSAVPLETVRIGTRLLNADGHTLAERIIYCRDPVPIRLLRDLSLTEVSIIGNLKPPRTFRIQPGQRSPFLAIFARPPRGAVEFTTRVVAARRHV